MLAPMIRQMTRGERLWMEMARRGWTWGEVMARREITRWRLTEWLEDRGEDIPETVLAGPLTKIESCRLARRRAGWSRATAAVALGIPREEIMAMEYGRSDVRPLYGAWAARGWPPIAYIGVVEKR